MIVVYVYYVHFYVAYIVCNTNILTGPAAVSIYYIHCVIMCISPEICNLLNKEGVDLEDTMIKREVQF